MFVSLYSAICFATLTGPHATLIFYYKTLRHRPQVEETVLCAILELLKTLLEQTGSHSPLALLALCKSWGKTAALQQRFWALCHALHATAPSAAHSEGVLDAVAHIDSSPKCPSLKWPKSVPWQILGEVSVFHKINLTTCHVTQPKHDYSDFLLQF